MTFFFLFSQCAFASTFTYSVSEVRGAGAYLMDQGSSHRSNLQQGMTLQEGDTVQTGARTVILLDSSNGHKVQIGANSTVSMRDAGEENNEHFNIVELISGSVRSIIAKSNTESKKFELRSKAVRIGVRGTDFLSVLEGEGLAVYLREGKLLLQNQVVLTAGRKAVFGANGALMSTASMSGREFAEAIERSGFGSESGGGGGGGVAESSLSQEAKQSTKEDLIRKGDVAGIKALRLSPSELNDLGSGEGALHVAAQNGRSELVAMLLEAHADLNGQDKGGKTPLMVAVERKNIPTIEKLLAAGADKKIKDSNGLSAFDYARRSGSREIQNLMER